MHAAGSSGATKSQTQAAASLLSERGHLVRANSLDSRTRTSALQSFPACARAVTLVRVRTVTVLEVIQRSAEFLAQRGVDSPRLQIESMLAHVLKLPRLQPYLNF